MLVDIEQVLISTDQIIRRAFDGALQVTIVGGVMTMFNLSSPGVMIPR